LFKSQKGYLLYNIGGRIDITCEQNTKDLVLEEKVEQQKSAKKQSADPGFRFEYEDVSETYWRFATQAVTKGVVMPAPREYLKMIKEASQRNFGAMILALGDGPLTAKDIEAKAKEILKAQGCKVTTWDTPAMTKRLLDKKIVTRKREKGKGAAYVYQIADAYRRK
jgi:hypothetical protein